MVASFNTPSGLTTIAFENGSRYHNMKGYFTTSSEELQKAIENSVLFGTEIILAEETIKEEAPKQESKEMIPTNYREMLTDPDNAIEEPSVTTIQKAKMWLQANYGKSFKSTSKDEIKREAATTYNALFPNWL